MKTLKYLGVFFVIVLTVVSCKSGEDPEKETKIKKAGALHDAALSLGEETLNMLNGAGGLVGELQDMMPSMDEEMKEEAEAHINSLSETKEDYSVWEQSLVEVPGHAHSHAEGEGHHHNHDHSMDNASPDEILAKQEELKDYIADIHNRLSKAIEAIQTMVDENGEE